MSGGLPPEQVTRSLPVPRQRAGEQDPNGKADADGRTDPPSRVAALKARKKTASDNWWAWGLELSAVCLPVLLTIIVMYVEKGRIEETSIINAIRRGDFLIPILIIYVDVARRWWLVSPRKRLGMALRWIAMAISGLAGILYIAAATLAAAVNISRLDGHAIDVVTISGMVGAAFIGTTGVAVSNRAIRSGRGG